MSNKQELIAKEKLIEELWYKRFPAHEINADHGRDMFWGTILCIFEDFSNLTPHSVDGELLHELLEAFKDTFYYEENHQKISYEYKKELITRIEKVCREGSAPQEPKQQSELRWVDNPESKVGGKMLVSVEQPSEGQDELWNELSKLLVVYGAFDRAKKEFFISRRGSEGEGAKSPDSPNKAEDNQQG